MAPWSLVLENKNLVRQEMFKIIIPVSWLDDYYQEGLIAMYQAALSCTDLLKYRGYARKRVRGALLNIDKNLVKVPRNIRIAAVSRKKSLKEIADDKSNCHTLEALEAADAVLNSTYSDNELEDVIDPHKEDFNRVELARSVERLSKELTPLEAAALEVYLRKDSLREASRKIGKPPRFLEHELTKAKRKAKRFV